MFSAAIFNQWLVRYEINFQKWLTHKFVHCSFKVGTRNQIQLNIIQQCNCDGQKHLVRIGLIFPENNFLMVSELHVYWKSG